MGVGRVNLSAVMDAIAAKVDLIDPLNVYSWPTDSVSPPAAIVAYPEDYAFDLNYGRGQDTITLPVWVVVGRVHDRSTKVDLAAYCDGSGPKSVKQAIEVETYSGVLDDAQVQHIDFDAIQIAGTDYMAAMFTVKITGRGTP